MRIAMKMSSSENVKQNFSHVSKMVFYFESSAPTLENVDFQFGYQQEFGSQSQTHFRSLLIRWLGS